MSFIKILLLAFGLILLGMLAFPLIAFIYNALWYLFWIAVVGLGGYVGYKWLTKESGTGLLEDRSGLPIDRTYSVNKAFEDFRRKHLTK